MLCPAAGVSENGEPPGSSAWVELVTETPLECVQPLRPADRSMKTVCASALVEHASAAAAAIVAAPVRLRTLLWAFCPSESFEVR